MPDYTPAYRSAAPLTLQHVRSELEGLRAMHTYATHHDDVLVLDELFCRVVTLEHAILQMDQETELRPRVGDSLSLLDRALKWAWLAREEETHANGMYADKMKEAIAVLAEMELFLESVEHPAEMTEEPQPQEMPEEQLPQEMPEDQQPAGMTREQAETLASTIKARLPQAEVEVKEDEEDMGWVVEARNPRRGTTHVFRQEEEFEQLMEEAARRQSARAPM